MNSHPKETTDSKIAEKEWIEGFLAATVTMYCMRKWQLLTFDFRGQIKYLEKRLKDYEDE